MQHYCCSVLSAEQRLYYGVYLRDKMNEIKYKYCGKCKKRKLFSAFHKNKNGYRSYCKTCSRNYAKKYRQIHRTKLVKYYKEWEIVFVNYLRRRFATIKTRCTNPKHKSYMIYGGRGIQCRFKSSQEFVDYVINDLGYNTYEKIKELWIDRINNNGHYESGNIRFVSAKINNNNKRKNVKKEIKQ